MEEVQKVHDDHTVILAGDLNIRDSEIAQLNGLPGDMYDLWVKLGKRKEAQYTWDCLRNTNVEVRIEQLLIFYCILNRREVNIQNIHCVAYKIYFPATL